MKTNEPRHDKTNKISVHPAKTRISLGIQVFAVHSMDSKGPKVSSCGQRRLWSDWIFAGRIVILLVLLCRGSNNKLCRLLRSSLIKNYTVCLDLSVRKLRIIMVSSLETQPRAFRQGEALWCWWKSFEFPFMFYTFLHHPKNRTSEAE